MAGLVDVLRGEVKEDLVESISKQMPSGESLTRRGFIGGAAAVFSVMSARTALGSEANERVTAGIIGLGGRGSMIAQMLEEHGGYQIVAVADYFPEVAERAGERFKTPQNRRFTGLMGYRRLIESGVDAVFLETPPCFFPEHAEAAVAAGCHVFIAKPLACDVPGCLAVEAAGKAATGNGKVFLVDFQTRTDALFIEAVRQVRAGDYGKLGLLSALYADEAFSDPPFTETIESRLQHLVWVNDTALGGGYLVNAGIHAVDVGLWIAGEAPVSAMGCSRVIRNEPHGDAHDVYSITFQFPSGLVLNMRGEHLRNRFGFASDCAAYCQEGYLETQYAGQVRIVGNSKSYEGGAVEALYTRGAQRNIDAFHRSIVEGDPENATLAPSVTATLATILGREAALRNTQLTWDEVMKENKRLEVDLAGLKT